MDIILKNVNVKVQSIVRIEPQILDNLVCDLQHTQYGYYLHKTTGLSVYQFAVESGKTYKLNSRFNALADTVQALLITTALTNESYEGQYKQIPSNTVVAEYNKYGETGAPTQTGYYNIEFTAASNGYLVCYAATSNAATLIEV